ncbi:hypothetical protein MOQ72_03995 [Saccharopolyspora sp. K220]|uniref:hypothetical protein n=1 Tax=Saccharopolyspora soli TaxID=2926618 RepID=UPI001F566915|nr:hypothetical protein [Saccharopolyspora soli]MCI2416573.1 hypothetical protein [Saccharopolyspora soli]
MNARIDLAIIAGLAESPNDRTTKDAETTRRQQDGFLQHLAWLLTPGATVRLRPCGCEAESDGR